MLIGCAFIVGKGTGIEKSKKGRQSSQSVKMEVCRRGAITNILFFSPTRDSSPPRHGDSHFLTDWITIHSLSFLIMCWTAKFGGLRMQIFFLPPSRLTPRQQSLPSQGQSGERSNLASRDMNFWSVAGRLLLPQAYSNPIGQPALMKTGRGPPQWRWLTVARISL